MILFDGANHNAFKGMYSHVVQFSKTIPKKNFKRYTASLLHQTAFSHLSLGVEWHPIEDNADKIVLKLLISEIKAN